MLWHHAVPIFAVRHEQPYNNLCHSIRKDPCTRMYVWVLTVHDVIQMWTKWRHNLQESNKGRVAVEFLWWFFLLKWLVCWSLCANPPCWWSDVWVMLKNLERADRKKHCNLLLWLRGTVKTQIAFNQKSFLYHSRLQRFPILPQTRKEIEYWTIHCWCCIQFK